MARHRPYYSYVPAPFRLPLALFMLAAIIISYIDWEGVPELVVGAAQARDGDSLVIGRHRIRLQGIDAPEIGQTCRKSGKPWPCGRNAKRHLARLIGNHDVTCTITKRDRFDRLLAQCRVGQRDLNLSMVRDGMAVSFGENFRREEQVAKRQKIGIWAGEFLQPQQWRRENGRS